MHIQLLLKYIFKEFKTEVPKKKKNYNISFLTHNMTEVEVTVNSIVSDILFILNSFWVKNPIEFGSILWLLTKARLYYNITIENDKM